jgi:hypothetical protein
MGELDALHLRDEVLQAMYWMRSEGLADACTARELARFLAVPEPVLAPLLVRFTREGWLEEAAGRYALSARGTEAGKRTFAEEFADVTGATHGECDESCWCHESPEAAASCLEERRGHVHQH